MSDSVVYTHVQCTCGGLSGMRVEGVDAGEGEVRWRAAPSRSSETTRCFTFLPRMSSKHFAHPCVFTSKSQPSSTVPPLAVRPQGPLTRCAHQAHNCAENLCNNAALATHTAKGNPVAETAESEKAARCSVESPAAVCGSARDLIQCACDAKVHKGHVSAIDGWSISPSSRAIAWHTKQRKDTALSEIPRQASQNSRTLRIGSGMGSRMTTVLTIWTLTSGIKIAI
mmetsp:Transcript_28913/g.83862  ORF Transcript_28913/g.83862 Transcript_28913/m.83862 type:complete len:226 (-) Transcript_28913:3976-4653(-)